MRAPLIMLLALALGCPSAQTSPPEKPDAPKTQPPERSPAGLDYAAVEIDTAEGSLRFKVELAQTNPERQRGLMFRETLSDDDGMLFIFNQMREQRFWMKNTKIPLDMIFIDDRGVIACIVENAEPMTTTSRSCGEPSQYVLELAGGASRRMGIQAGQGTRFIDVPGHPTKLGTPEPRRTP